MLTTLVSLIVLVSISGELWEEDVPFLGLRGGGPIVPQKYNKNTLYIYIYML